MKREIIDTVLYFIFLLVAVWAIVTFVGQRTVVNGVSMYDTLNDGDNLWVDKFSYHFKDPQRFDIVVFPMYDGEEYFIKRIIGLPGETVRIDHQGNIYINGEKLEESYGYETIEPGMIGRAFDGVTLGDDEYFVMGDNRNESEDSRFDIVGNVKREDLMGKAVFRLWPIATFGTID
ncbi:MAG: signal peptidase I [Lachnospiraceae bacterium]|nr:signal peptidase I [Lachnospiraceae bacterium]